MKVRFLLWSLSSLGIVLALAIAFAYAPQSMRRIGLIYLIFGVLSGMAFGRLAREFELNRSRFLPVIAFVVVLIGGTQLAWASFQQLKAARSQQIENDPEQLAMLNLAEEMASDDPELVERYRQERRNLQPRFNDYLKFRYSKIGKSAENLSIVFWSLELICAATLASLMVWRTPLASDTTTKEIET
ncbi:hypothetical protein AB1L42_19900 [Thalassoglobus sp. JC818]|uniref:hypothetical protein n=1 Tax=Thalassoglobus sp. JC818 TaxID=3232136 RepID=UPI003458EE91